MLRALPGLMNDEEKRNHERHVLRMGFILSNVSNAKREIATQERKHQIPGPITGAVGGTRNWIGREGIGADGSG